MPAQRKALRGSRPPKVTPIKRGPKKAWRYRAQIWDPLASDGAGAFVSPCQILRIPKQTFATAREAWKVIEQAEQKVSRASRGVTIGQVRKRWLARTHWGQNNELRESTTSHNTERTKWLEQFADELPWAVEDELLAHARDQLSGQQREAAKAMFNYAVELRLIDESPLRHLKVAKSSGNKNVFPPHETELRKLLSVGRNTSPMLADWIEFGSLVGIRCGETDGLQFSDFNQDFSRVRILRQYNARTRSIAEPKAGHKHEIAVPPRAREIVRRQLDHMRHPDDYVFKNTRGNHWTPSSRAYHWNAMMVAAGFRRVVGEKTVSDFTPYLATRHYCGWYLINVKLRTAEETAHQLRHDDGGDLVRKLYGKRDRTMAIDAIALCQEDDETALA